MLAMERSTYAPMALSNEAPNPLRPYYRPPSIGMPSEAPPNASSFGEPGTKRSSASFGTSARDILSDLHYSDILAEAGPSTGASIKRMLDQGLWKYSSILMAQPFDIAKTVLQCHIAMASHPSKEDVFHRHPSGYRDTKSQDVYPSEDEADDDEDEPSYFTSSAPHHTSTSYAPIDRRKARGYRTPSSTAIRPPASAYRLQLRKADSIFEVLSQLWQKEGSWGIFKGTNVTFLYSVLLKTVETWTRSCLSAVLNIPDPGRLAGASGVGGLDVIDSPFPLASLGVAVTAAAVGGLLLAPLDIVRTHLILTSSEDINRSIFLNLRSLSTWFCPPSLLVPTLIHTTLPTLISTSTPLFLRSNLRIDPILTPATYSICAFLASTVELFLRLPFETVLRRGQMSLMSESQTFKPPSQRRSRSRQSSSSELEPPKLHTVVDVAPYTGVASTMWRIMREEGETLENTASTKGSASANRHMYTVRKGQGVQGLWRGWRVGWWGLVGVWGAAALGGVGGKGGEF